MKIVAIIYANLDQSPLLTASRLAEDLAGQPVLQRTIQRVVQAQRLDAIILLGPSSQITRIEKLAAHPKVEIRAFDGPAYPLQQTVRMARKWALQSWRGGLANTCFFDEHTHPTLCATVATQLQADAVVSIAAEGPLIDPQLIDAMIAHYEQHVKNVRLVFAQAPPGLVPAVFDTTLLVEMAQNNLLPGWTNSYKPDQPQRDMINWTNCFRPALSILHAAGRLTSDTQRGFQWLKRLCAASLDQQPASAICQRLNEIRTQEPDIFPQDIHIELATEDQLEKTIFRPRGLQVGKRQPMTLPLFEKLIREISQYDDTTVVLGGFGEPLLHPQFDAFLKICRSANVFGLAVRTNGIALNTTHMHSMIDHGVDVVQYLLDAHSADHYEQFHGYDYFEQVKKNIDKLNELRVSKTRITPVTVATQTKSRQTMDSMAAFYDHWTLYSGWSVIEGYSHYAQQLPDHSVTTMSPPTRIPCRQLRHRCMVLCNGDVVGCDQDFKGLFIAGNISQSSLQDIWNGPRFQSLRHTHQQKNYSYHPLCEKCNEWHRP